MSANDVHTDISKKYKKETGNIREDIQIPNLASWGHSVQEQTAQEVS